MTGVVIRAATASAKINLINDMRTVPHTRNVAVLR